MSIADEIEAGGGMDEAVALWQLHEQAKGLARKVLEELLIAHLKPQWPAFAGFCGPSRTNCKRSWTLLSYHHPAQLCWSWSIWFHLFPKDGQWWRIWGGYKHQRWFGMKRLFRFSLLRQPHYRYMLSLEAKQRLRAAQQEKLK